MKITKTPYFSYRIGKLADGCRMCVKGEKLVLFETGLCGNNCEYCPISEQKKNKDATYANERPVKKTKDIIEEARICSSRGAGITGGDPLTTINRTVKHIQLLKQKFGRKFHIHLYTPLNLVTKEKLKKLYSAGLDEIRVHPKLDNNRQWHRINRLKELPWSVGMEIPVMPGKERQTKKLLDYAKNKADFVNLNELELSDTNTGKLQRKGLKPKEEYSYAVKGSEKLAMKLLNHCLKNGFKRVHYCTVKLKDGVQLYNRIRKRAENVKQDFDIKQNNGILVRGAAYLPELKPGFSYKQKLARLTAGKRAAALKKLHVASRTLKKNKIRTAVDSYKLRLLTAAKDAKKHKELIKQNGLVPAVVEEYPTFDGFEVSIEFLQ